MKAMLHAPYNTTHLYYYCHQLDTPVWSLKIQFKLIAIRHQGPVQQYIHTFPSARRRTKSCFFDKFFCNQKTICTFNSPIHGQRVRAFKAFAYYLHLVGVFFLFKLNSMKQLETWPNWYNTELCCFFSGSFSIKLETIYSFLSRKKSWKFWSASTFFIFK